MPLNLSPWQQQYAGVDREPIWAALKSHFDTKVGELFKIVSRKHIMPPQLAMESQPALFIVQLREERKGSKQGAPNTVALTGWLIVYAPAYLTEDAPGDETSLAATQLNAIFKAIDGALVPDNMQTGKFTLGGLVTHCWIEGELDQDPGLFTNQASAIIPIHILVP